jgi:hypothetical protein
MSDDEGGESKSMGAFLLGFLTGVLVCLGVGGAFFVVQSRLNLERMRMEEMRAREAMEVAEMERDRARVSAEQARLAKEKAEKVLREVEAAKEKEKKDR